jgi:type I restriction enzyme S subunit
MEVKPGYKRTEVGVIPEEWEVKSLGSFCEIVEGRDLVKAGYASTDDGRHPFPIYSNALTNKGLYGYSSSHQYEPDKITVTARGDIGHAVYRSTRFCAIGRLLVMSSKRACDLRFVTEFINNFVDFALESTGVPQLTAPQISNYVVALPPTKAEQETIAEALSDADALIESLEQLLTKKRHIKQGAMQGLLSGKKRLPGFSGEWEETILGSVTERIIGGGTPSRNVPSYWNGSIPWMTVKDFANHSPLGTLESITRDGLRNSTSNLIPRQTLITSTRMALGKAVIFQVDVCINQDLKAIFPCRETDTRFLYYWFQFNESRIADMGSGSTVMGISLGELRNIAFTKPARAEQIAVAAILLDMDAEIAAVEAKLAKARSIKQGMMQELLTGRVRLV